MPPKINHADPRYRKVCIDKATGEMLPADHPAYCITQDTQTTLVLTFRDYKNGYSKRRVAFDQEQRNFIREPIQEKKALENNAVLSILPFAIPENKYTLNTQSYEVGGASVLEFKMYPSGVYFGKDEGKLNLKRMNSLYALRVFYENHEMLIWLGFTTTNKLDEDNYWFPAVTLDPYSETIETKRTEHSFRIRFFADRGCGRSFVVSFLSAADFCDAFVERKKTSRTGINLRLPHLAMVNDDPMALAVPLPKRESDEYQSVINQQVAAILRELNLPFDLKEILSDTKVRTSAAPSFLHETVRERSKRGNHKPVLSKALAMEIDTEEGVGAVASTSASSDAIIEQPILTRRKRQLEVLPEEAENEGAGQREKTDDASGEPEKKRSKHNWYNVLEKQKNHYQRLFQDKETQLARKKNKISELKQTQTSLRKKNNSQRALLKQQANKIASLSLEIAQRQAETSDTKALQARLAELQQKESAFERAREEQIKLKKQVTELQNSLAIKQSLFAVDRQKLEEQIILMASEKEKSQKAYEAQIAEKTKEIAELVAAIDEFETLTATQAIAFETGEANLTRESLVELNSTRSLLETSLAAKTTELESANQLLETARAEIGQLKANLIRTQEQMSALEKSYQESLLAITQSRNEIQELRHEGATVSAHLWEANTRVEQLQGVTSYLQQKLIALEQTSLHLATENEHLKREHERYKQTTTQQTPDQQPQNRQGIQQVGQSAQRVSLPEVITKFGFLPRSSAQSAATTVTTAMSVDVAAASAAQAKKDPPRHLEEEGTSASRPGFF